MYPYEKQILETFANLVRKKVSLNSIVLFGSRARGDSESDSDMDVLVIVNDLTEKDEDYISECAWEAGFESGVVVVPVVFSRVEWENGPERYSLLAEAVKLDGVYLWKLKKLKDLSKDFHKAFELRQTVDYKVIRPITFDRAKEAWNKATDFVQEIQRYLLGEKLL